MLLVSLVLATRGFALDPTRSIHQYNCQTWSQQHGLPANGINAIVQTDDGYLWLGANAGLIRFDGVSFTLVGMAQKPGLRTTEVLSLAAAPGGRLWFAIKSSAYGGYDGRGNWNLAKESGDGTDWGPPVVMGSRDGRLWIGGENPSVRSPDGQVQRLFPDETTPKFVSSFLEDSRGRIWAGTDRKGLYYLDQGKWVSFFAGAPDSSITALVEGQNGQLWIGDDSGVICLDAHGVRQEISFPGGRVRAMLMDRHGVLWVGTFGNGLLRYYNGKWSSLKNTDGLADDLVLALAEDREGSLWIGTRGGLSQLTDVKLPTFGLKEGLNSEIALGVSASPRGGLWAGTPTGAAYFDGQKFTRYYDTNSGLPMLYFKRALEARNGDVYALSGLNEIIIFADGKFLTKHATTQMPVALLEDAQGVVVSVGNDLFRVGRDQLTPFPFTNGVKPELYWVLNLAAGREGAILVACGNGIARIKDGAFEQWTLNDGLADTQGRWVFEDRDGTIWAGLSTGIARIRGREIRNIRRENGLYDGNIGAMVPDDAGNFWVDSNRGIFCVARQSLNDFADGKIPRVTCVSYDGPAAIKPADKYHQEQSACRTLDGRIWFPGSRGIIMIDPTNVLANPLPPPVHIARASANGQELGITNGTTVPPGKGELEFQYAGLSYIVPQNIRFRYQLEGYDPDWVEAENRRLAVYNNLKPGRYTFRVTAANGDGVWNKTGDSLTLELLPHFQQTFWFYLLCGGLGLAALGGIYVGRVRHLTSKQAALQQARDLLEAEVASRTAELATANASLQHEEAQLKQRTEALEKEIEERKRMQLEIERVHRQLLETSRQAGMAEVATSVLHNVGNVLNSVNVSSTLLFEQVKKSKIVSVGRLAALLREHAGNLGEFMTTDPKGQRIPDFLTELTTHLATEQAVAMTELTALHKNIEHIKDIVAMQQSFAKVGGVTQSVALAELLDESLRMNESSLLRHDVQVIREYDAALPEIILDKHKVMQILVNLIRNAKHACQDSDRADKRLTVRVANGEGRIKISVIDNGIGIPPENLTRIFNHGFTTRKDGHGFGLHSGALAAKEMGGSLNVQSDGPGQGATFTLDLPCPAQENRHE